MALSKSIDTSYGVQANYHKITETKIDWHNKVANITVQSFIDEAARTLGKMAIMTHSYYWASDDFIFYPAGNVLADAYTKLKLMESWADSIDV
jgi:hypothetical protein